MEDGKARGYPRQRGRKARGCLKHGRWESKRLPHTWKKGGKRLCIHGRWKRKSYLRVKEEERPELPYVNMEDYS
jgi:hypothetical protein